MKSLILQIVAILAVFFIILLALGAQFGTVEISIWGVTQIALIVFVILRYRRASSAEDS
ncbi:hypothetical protein [Streptomyces sp. NPDC002853]